MKNDMNVSFVTSMLGLRQFLSENQNLRWQSKLYGKEKFSHKGANTKVVVEIRQMKVDFYCIQLQMQKEKKSMVFFSRLVM